MSELLQNIDAVLGIAMSVLALLGFGSYFGRGRPTATAAVATAEPQRVRRRSGFGRFFWVLLFLGAAGIGGYMAMGRFDGRSGYSRGDNWRGGHDRGSRSWYRGGDDRRR